MEAIFNLKAELPRFEPGRLSLSARGVDDLGRALDLALERLRAGEVGGPSDEVEAKIRGLCEELAAMKREQEERVKRTEAKGAAWGRSGEAYEMARRYCMMSAAGAAVQVWMRNRGWMGGMLGRGEWVVVMLERVMRSLGEGRVMSEEKYEEEVGEEMVRMYEEGRLFSAIPFRLAETEGRT